MSEYALSYTGAEVNELLSAVDETVDYIVAEGTSGIWTWVKYASGLAVCFGKNIETVDITHSQDDNYYGYVSVVDYPFAFASAPFLVRDCSDASGNVWTIRQSNDSLTTTPRMFPMACGSATGYTVTSTYIAIGRWK